MLDIIIVETMQLLVPQNDPEEYPDQNMETKAFLVQQGLLTFVHRVALEHLASADEGDMLIFQVAMKLLEHCQGRLSSRVLAERLAARLKNPYGSSVR